MSWHFDDETTVPHPYCEGKTPTGLGTSLGYLLPAFLNQSTKFDQEVLHPLPVLSHLSATKFHELSHILKQKLYL
jgi:hypothetical protein